MNYVVINLIKTRTSKKAAADIHKPTGDKNGWLYRRKNHTTTNCWTWTIHSSVSQILIQHMLSHLQLTFYLPVIRKRECGPNQCK